jgi:hypothetical protein
VGSHLGGLGAVHVGVKDLSQLAQGFLQSFDLLREEKCEKTS